MSRRFTAASALAVTLAAVVLAGMAAAGPFAVASPGTAPSAFAVDSVHSCVLFRVRHNGIGNIYGRFNEFEGTLSFDPENSTLSELQMTVRADSVDTNNNGRDNHIKSADYFNTEAYPEMTFRATEPVTVTAGQVSQLKGEMNFKGTSKEVTADLEWIGSAEGRRGMRVGFEARLTIKRSDYGEANVGGVSDEVLLIVAVEAVQQRSE